MPSLRSAVITQLMASMGHEQVVFVADREVGLRALIAIHSTALGPALGGVRFWHYASEHDAMVDALRLSEAMTLKAAVAGLHQGGGKTVVHWDDPDRPRPAALLHALGRAIDELGGRYLAAEDVGATTGRHERARRGDAVGHGRRRVARRLRRPVAGHRVRRACTAMRAACSRRSTATRRCAAVGSWCRARVTSASHLVALARRRRRRGRRCRTSSTCACRRARAASWASSASRSTPRCEHACDVLAPCALGGVFDDESIPRLQCRAIVGAANNQLGVIGADRMLAARGILYAPDFVVNAGGIINIAEEFAGYDRESRARARGARSRPRPRGSSRSRASAASRRCAPPSSSPVSALAEEGATRAAGSPATRRPGPTASRSAPSARDAPHNEPASANQAHSRVW